MVARIKIGKSIKGILSYNETKIREGKASLLLASGFSTDAEEMTFSQRLRRFEKLNQRNEKIKTNAIHISLNFPPEENPNAETLQKIAADYMARIGFRNQPYLVYQHFDANHTHIHIVTTPIRYKGKSIKTHNIGRDKSEPARKAIELEFGLITAESRKKSKTFTQEAIDPATAEYGKTETKRTISNIVREVTDNYKFTNLEELNAILKLYNVTAYRGSVGSRQYNNGGLSYCILDKDGYRIGVPIKASSIYGSPTLPSLEKKYERNKVRKIPYKKYMEAKVKSVLKNQTSLQGLMAGLEKKNIQYQLQRDSKGEIKGLYLIDTFNRTIYNSEEIGIPWEAFFMIRNKVSQIPGNDRTRLKADDLDQFKIDISIEIIAGLLSAEQATSEGIPGLSRKPKKKKRKR